MFRGDGPAQTSCQWTGAAKRYSGRGTQGERRAGSGNVARRSINDAAKVVLAAFVLGPPIGGITVMALLQVVPWFATGFADPAPQFGANLVKSVLLAVPLSYLVGGIPAVLAGLALAAYFAWGGRITVWACLVAALIYPAVLVVSGADRHARVARNAAARDAARRHDLHRVAFRGARLLPVVAQHQAGAGLRRQAPRDFRMTMIDPGSTARAPLFGRIKNILLQPREEWPRIAAEPETIGSLYTNYIIPVAGFAVLCSLHRQPDGLQPARRHLQADVRRKR